MASCFPGEFANLCITSCSVKALLYGDTELCEDKYNEEFCEKPPLFTLEDISAQTVAKHFSSRYLQQNCSNIPKVLAKRIMFWSFPRSYKDILRYSWDIECHMLDISREPVPFQFKNVIQVGFCVQGTVSYCDEEFDVSLVFDRCVITKVECSCGSKCILWCIHAIVLALHRLFSNDIEVCMPLSNSIDQFNRDQLQKLQQYVLNDHQENVGGIVNSIQKNVSHDDRLLRNSLDVNEFPTFLRADGIPSWFINMETTIVIVSHSMANKARGLMASIIEMLNANNRNGLRIFECLVKAGIDIPFYVQMDKRLLRLWTYSLAAPDISAKEKQNFCSLLRSLPCHHAYNVPLPSRLNARNCTLAPFENFASSPFDVGNEHIYLMPLCAACITWEDPQLKRILSNRNILSKEYQEFIWREHLPTSCVRVRGLQSSGRHAEALRLSIAIAMGIKDQVRRWKERWREVQICLDPSQWRAQKNISGGILYEKTVSRSYFVRVHACNYLNLEVSGGDLSP